MQEKLINALNNRYATKKFDNNKNVPSEIIEKLIEATRLTPTSYGLQFMKIVLVENKEIRKSLVPHSYGQEQVADASHLFVLCREKNINEGDVATYISNISKTRNVPEEALTGFKDMMVNSIFSMPEEAINTWMNNQVYIALGQLLTSCALLDIDACPMEGFSKNEYDKALGLEDKNLASVLVVPVGYRSSDDQNAHAKKVRRATEDFLVTI